MACKHNDSRRRFLRYAMIGGIAVPVYSNFGLLSTAQAKAFNLASDLDLENLVLFRTLPFLEETSIGHALISHALYVGLDRSVRDYLSALRIP